jgi:sugar/nucleoside kinase (ribokinase family)
MPSRAAYPLVLSLGEILVDWVSPQPGASLAAADSWVKAPGGAPANLAVALARQGLSAAFLGCVSGDLWGAWLKDVLVQNGVDTTGVIVDATAQTRMAYVLTTEKGDRKMAQFSRIACADTRLNPADLNQAMFARSRVFHFGSISMLEKPSLDATHAALALARANKMLVSFDPNVRLALWPDEDSCRERIVSVLASGVDLLKVNEDELLFLTGSTGESAACNLKSRYPISLLVVTLAGKGALYVDANGQSALVPGYAVRLIEATGAGDAFAAGVIAGLLPHLLDSKRNDLNCQETLKGLTVDQVTAIVRRANAMGALTCTKSGAIPALPTVGQVDDFLSTHR